MQRKLPAYIVKREGGQNFEFNSPIEAAKPGAILAHHSPLLSYFDCIFLSGDLNNCNFVQIIERKGAFDLTSSS